MATVSDGYVVSPAGVAAACLGFCTILKPRPSGKFFATMMHVTSQRKLRSSLRSASMQTTTAQPPTRYAALAARAPNIVDNGLYTRTSAVPDWLARLDQFAHLTAAAAADRRATLQILDDDTVVDLLVLSYLRHGTPYTLWADTLAGPRTSSRSPRRWSCTNWWTRRKHRGRRMVPAPRGRRSRPA